MKKKRKVFVTFWEIVAPEKIFDDELDQTVCYLAGLDDLYNSIIFTCDVTKMEEIVNEYKKTIVERDDKNGK